MLKSKSSRNAKPQVSRSLEGDSVYSARNPDIPRAHFSIGVSMKKTDWASKGKLEKHAKVEAVRALCTASAFETALRQGYRPPAERKKLNRRIIEGVAEPQNIVILAE